MTPLKKFWSDDSGQGLPEYGLLVAAVVVMVVIVSALFSDTVQNLLSNIGNYIQSNDGLP